MAPPTPPGRMEAMMTPLLARRCLVGVLHRLRLKAPDCSSPRELFDCGAAIERATARDARSAASQRARHEASTGRRVSTRMLTQRVKPLQSSQSLCGISRSSNSVLFRQSADVSCVRVCSCRTRKDGRVCSQRRSCLLSSVSSSDIESRLSPRCGLEAEGAVTHNARGVFCVCFVWGGGQRRAAGLGRLAHRWPCDTISELVNRCAWSGRGGTRLTTCRSRGRKLRPMPHTNGTAYADDDDEPSAAALAATAAVNRSRIVSAAVASLPSARPVTSTAGSPRVCTRICTRVSDG